MKKLFVITGMARPRDSKAMYSGVQQFEVRAMSKADARAVAEDFLRAKGLDVLQVHADEKAEQ
jgi:hypothetical protein